MEGGVGEREVDIVGAMVDEHFHWQAETMLFHGREEERDRYLTVWSESGGLALYLGSALHTLHVQVDFT